MRPRRILAVLAVLAVPAGFAAGALTAAPAAAAAPQRCPSLLGGTAGDRETDVGRTGPDRGNGLGPGDRTDAPRSLPARVDLRGPSATYNRRYAFAVARGRVWFTSRTEVTGIRQPWARLPLPACLDGHVTQISADDDEMIALDDARSVYTLDYALGDPAHFTWTRRWGPPFWQGDGRRLPAGMLAWSWSVISPREDGTWTDAAGHRQRVGADKVSHVWMLLRGGRELRFTDPWLARDLAYRMCKPRRDRFVAAGLSTSGSTIFVVGRHGDLYTRLYDFDIAGDDPVFFSYAYADQRRARRPVIQLPSPAWVRQPKVPGRITSAISVEKRGRGAVHRILRVEGRDARGHTGYWQKDVTQLRPRAWRFHRTGRPLHGRPLSNPPGDTSGRGLAAGTDLRYVRGRAAGWSGEIASFNLVCSPTRLRVRVGGAAPLDLVLHTTDSIRLLPRGPGLDSVPWGLYGNIEVPAATWARRARLSPPVRGFLRRALGGRRYTDTPIEVTRDTLAFPKLGWTFRAAASP